MSGPRPQQTLTIRVYNFAQVPARKLRRAQGEAAWIIRGAGVEPVWLNCTPSGRSAHHRQGPVPQTCSGKPVVAAIVGLRILGRSNYAGAALNEDALGYAVQPVLATVLYDRVANLAELHGYADEAPEILGAVMAHEIGHLLLGPHSHSLHGIMGGRWDPAQLQRATQGCLEFTPDQSARIRAANEAGIPDEQTVLASAK